MLEAGQNVLRQKQVPTKSLDLAVSTRSDFVKISLLKCSVLNLLTRVVEFDSGKKPNQSSQASNNVL